MPIILTLVIHASLLSFSFAQGTMSTDDSESSSAEASLSGFWHLPSTPLNAAELQEDAVDESSHTPSTSGKSDDRSRSVPHRPHKRRHESQP